MNYLHSESKPTAKPEEDSHPLSESTYIDTQTTTPPPFKFVNIKYITPFITTTTKDNFLKFVLRCIKDENNEWYKYILEKVNPSATDETP